MSTITDDDTDQLEAPLRFGGPKKKAEKERSRKESRKEKKQPIRDISVGTTFDPPYYKHVESIDNRFAHDMSNTGTFPIFSHNEFFPQNGHSSNNNGHSNGAEGVDQEGGKLKKWHKIAIGVAVAIFVLLLIGFLVYFSFPSATAASSALSAPAPVSSATIQYDTALPPNNYYAAQRDQGIDIAEAEDGIEINFDEPPTTTFYYPSPMPSAPPSPAPFSPSNQPAAAFRPRRGSSEDGKPPPASWFGADAPTRGDTSNALPLDGELQNQEAINQIYSKGNCVLGNQNKPPYITVNENAARQIGWAETPIEEENSVGSMAEFSSAGSARSMSELYEADMTNDNKHYREGSSASTVVTADQAGAGLQIGPDRAEQFAAGRDRAKEITAEAARAIGSIYTKKRKASAGLTAASMIQQKQKGNDANYQYFDTTTQQPV